MSAASLRAALLAPLLGGCLTPSLCAIDAGPNGHPCAPVDYCTSVPSLPQDPTIDGVLEGGLALAPLEPPAGHWLGASALGETRASYAVAWRPGGLYVYIEVHKLGRFPSTAPQFVYCGDAVDLFVDDDGAWPDPSTYPAVGTRDFEAVAPASDATMAMRGAIYARGAIATSDAQGDTWSGDFGTYARDDGYTFEAFVRGADLDEPGWALAAGHRVGMDVGVFVSNGTTAMSGGMYCPLDFGELLLHTASCTACVTHPSSNLDALCRPTLAP